MLSNNLAVRRNGLRAALILAIAAVAACDTSDDAQPVDSAVAGGEVDRPATRGGMAAEDSLSGGMSDAKIVDVIRTANSQDSSGGVMAQSMARNAQVKDYGRQMVVDHGGANNQLMTLAQRTNLTPEENEIVRQLQQEHTTAAAHLRGLTGAEFDRAYIDHEVEMHQKLLTMLDERIVPNVQNAELRTFLGQIRPTIAAHLQRAQRLQNTLTTSQ